MNKYNKIIGIHIKNNNKDNIYEKIKHIYDNNGRIIQLFVNNIKNINEVCNYLKKYNMLCVVHASYTINISQPWNKYSWWVQKFILEIECASKLNAFGIVIHLGKQLNLSFEEAINNMYSLLLYVHKLTNKTKVKILIETSSGQGSEMCYKIEQLAYFYNKFKMNKNKEIKNRFGLCVDTCHIFVSGSNIKNIKSVKKYFDTFDKLIGINEIKLIHLNDSKNDINTKLDRHENIGYGFIGDKSLLFIAKMFIYLSTPIILETPYDNDKKNSYVDMLKILSFIK